MKMGQYFLIVNLDKKQFIHPHTFRDGLKLLEFGCSSHGTLTALTLLLRNSSEGGGGDFHEFENCDLVGSWAGDRIVIIGDYDQSGLYHTAENSFTNISETLIDQVSEFDKHLFRK